MVRHIVRFGMLIAAALPAFAQGPHAQVLSLGNLNTSHVQLGAEMANGGAVSSSGQLYFAGKDSERGTEVWSAQTGAAIVSDLRPGVGSSNPSQFTTVGSYVIWVADDGTHGPEIRGSATLSPSSVLIDLQPGASHEPPVILGSAAGCVWFTTTKWGAAGPRTVLWAMTNFGNPSPEGEYEHGSVSQPTAVPGSQSLLFLAREPNDPRPRLYHIRGTQGAQPVENLDPGNAGVPLLNPAYAATSTFVCYRKFDGAYVLRAYDLETRQTTTLPALSDHSTLPWFATNGTDRVCYAAASAAQGVELWTTRRSSEGQLETAVLADVAPGSASSRPSRIIMSPGNPGAFFQVEQGAARDLYFVDPAESPSPVARRTKTGVHTSTQFAMLGAREIAMVVPLGPSVNQLWIGDGSTGAGSAVAEDFGEVFRLWNPQPAIPQPRDLCVHAMTQGENSLLRLSPMAQPWDSWYPLARLFHSGFQDVEVFSTGGRVLFTADYPNGSYQPPAELTPVLVTPLNMSLSGGGSVEPSSMPADFTECAGALLFTAGVGDDRSLFASTDGQMMSAQLVNGIHHVEQLVRFQDRVYMLGHDTHFGTGAKKLFEARLLDGHVVVSSYDTTPHFSTSLVVAADRLFFVEPAGGGVERLYSIRPDYLLAGYQNFQMDSAGVGITQLTPAAGCLYFTAPASSSPGAKRVAWCTDGTAASTKTTESSPLHENPQLLGVMGDTCVFWTWISPASSYRLFLWDATTSLVPTQAGQGQMENAPAKSTVPGQPSGHVLNGRFYFTTVSGWVMSTDGTDLLRPFSTGSEVARPDTLAVLNDRLLFLTISPARSGWLTSFSEETGPQAIQYFPSGLHPCPLHVLNGRAYFSVITGSNSTSLWSTDGTQPGTTLASALPVYRSTARLPMGSYRGHLVLAYANPGSGLEPSLLNHTPAIPAAPLLTGARRGHPFSFTYAQMLTGTVTDADDDALEPLRLVVWEGTLMRNGTPVSSSTEIALGDTFQWLPGSSDSGILTPLQLYTSDFWQEVGADVRIRVDRPVDLWVQAHFTEEEIADPAIGGIEADVDGDGVANGLEFVFGRNPRTHTHEPPCTPSIAEASGGVRVVRFTFVRAAALPEDTVLTVEASPSLMPDSWQPVATRTQLDPWSGSATVSESTLPDNRVQVVVELPAPASGQTFMRLGVGL